MGILNKLLSEIKGDNNIDEIRQLCDMISEEEEENIIHTEIIPKGPNLFLTLEVPGRITNEIAFLSLERESEDVWLAVLFVTSRKEYIFRESKTLSIKRQRVWSINDNRPEMILTEYAKRYKFLRGE